MTTFETDARYLAKTYRRFPLEIAEGHGSLVTGTDGREYIDLGSGIAVNLFGLQDEQWKRAVIAQLDRFQHCSNLYCCEPVARLAELLLQLRRGGQRMRHQGRAQVGGRGKGQGIL